MQAAQRVRQVARRELWAQRQLIRVMVRLGAVLVVRVLVQVQLHKRQVVLQQVISFGIPLMVLAAAVVVEALAALVVELLLGQAVMVELMAAAQVVAAKSQEQLALLARQVLD